MKFSGTYDLNVEKQTVWKALNNHKILKQCIPGCEIFEKESDNVFNVKASNQIGPMNATFSGKIILSNIVENQSYMLSGEGKSPVGFANGTADIKLNEKNGFTILTYNVNFNVGGKIAQLGSRLIDGVAKKMSDYFFGRFSDLVSPLKKQSGEIGVQKRVVELKSNFLNKYIYSAVFILILLLVAIFYFVSR
jgi:carbon monoxide dehydrogenase subunit G